MKLSNQKEASSIGLFYTGAIILTATLLMTAYFGNILLLINYAPFLWSLLAVLVLLYRFGGYHYMNIEINNREADIKYYRIFLIGRKYKRIKIKGEQLHRIKVNNGFLGIGANLKLDINTTKGRARYPFIGLAAVSVNDRKRIADALHKIK